MRATLLIAILALAITASAEEKPRPKITKDIDKSTPILMQSQGGNDETHTEMPQTRAKDYNSSRSNTSSLMPEKDGGDYNSSRSNKTHTPARANNNGGGKRPGTDYNSSRSNNSGIVDPDNDCDSAGCPETRPVRCKDGDCKSATPIAQGSLNKTRAGQAPANHNTTRSNRTSE
jgi:hypothetical protein